MRNISTLMMFLGAVSLLTGCGGAGEPVKGVPMTQAAGDELLFDFNFPEGVAAWNPITDSVMGGISECNLATGEGFAIFAGNLSLENYGGFATVRSPQKDYDLGGKTGVTLRLRGDGKTYIFFIKTNEKDNGYQYQTWFKTTAAGTWEEFELPFADFTPHYRGMRLRLWARLDPADIQSMGFMIADKQSGPFKLDIQSIGTYGE